MKIAQLIANSNKQEWAKNFPVLVDIVTLDGTNGFRVVGVDFFDQSESSVSAVCGFGGDGFADTMETISKQFVDSVGLFVQVMRLRDGSRRNTNITEVMGRGDEGKITGEYRSMDLRSHTLEKAKPAVSNSLAEALILNLVIDLHFQWFSV